MYQKNQRINTLLILCRYLKVLVCFHGLVKMLLINWQIISLSYQSFSLSVIFLHLKFIKGPFYLYKTDK